MIQLEVFNLVLIIVLSVIVGIWLGVWAVQTIQEERDR